MKALIKNEILRNLFDHLEDGILFKLKEHGIKAIIELTMEPDIENLETIDQTIRNIKNPLYLSLLLTEKICHIIRTTLM
jgi:hypothetical protein